MLGKIVLRSNTLLLTALGKIDLQRATLLLTALRKTILRHILLLVALAVITPQPEDQPCPSLNKNPLRRDMLFAALLAGKMRCVESRQVLRRETASGFSSTCLSAAYKPVLQSQVICNIELRIQVIQKIILDNIIISVEAKVSVATAV